VNSNKVRNAFISTLEQCLDETLTEQQLNDWVQSYDLLLGVMKDVATEEKDTYRFSD